ncbi:hypothetical protein F0562_014098 [Nyssa sinensis]|uniref:DUF1771 domain-containing protein n=1 Tax=Nyssa sinensis TaxID=561372 RepID=A0A5J4ZQU3_9ASTE|nr:hypothetical protein F0562_014098 [Nyssa sinensis]
MEASSTSSLQNDDEGRVLEGLLDAFGSTFSLEEIASAYCKAGRNADLAGTMLYDLGSPSNTNNGVNSKSSSQLSHIHESNGEAQSEIFSETSSTTIFEKSSNSDRNSRASKLRSRHVSMGTISCVLDKSYVTSASLANQSCKITKPLKLDSNEFLASELWREKSSLNLVRDDDEHNDVEDFLFKMLGDGFQLDKTMIRKVLGSCGYDLKKSMEKLLDLSATTLDRKDNFLGESTKKSVDRGPREQSERNELQEVLAALFHASKRYEEFSERTVAVKIVKRSRTSGQVVVEPLSDTIVEHKTCTMNPHQDNEEDDGEDSYRGLRRAVKEYRTAMKEYYKAAVEAFAEEDLVRANKLLEEGQFFHRKAREADEESVQKIFETRNEETEDVMSLDLHNHGAKEAIRLLKCHLSSLSGISSIKYLKVIVETNDEDVSKGARKRVIKKLLEKESIKWIEEGNAGTILICLDEIDPKRLSFAIQQR